MSAVILVTASTDEPVTRTETKLWLALDEHFVDHDDLIDGLIAKARESWEKRTQRAAMLQAFAYYPSKAPSDGCPVSIPKAPLVSVTAIRGYQSTDASDSGGTAMSTSGYYVDTAHEFGRVAPLSAFSFPTATRTINPFRIDFTAGYSSETTGVPDSVKVEIKQLVAQLYVHRGDELEQTKLLAAYGEIPTDLDLPTWG